MPKNSQWNWSVTPGSVSGQVIARASKQPISRYHGWKISCDISMNGSTQRLELNQTTRLCEQPQLGCLDGYFYFKTPRCRPVRQSPGEQDDQLERSTGADRQQVISSPERSCGAYWSILKILQVIRWERQVTKTVRTSAPHAFSAL